MMHLEDALTSTYISRFFLSPRIINRLTNTKNMQSCGNIKDHNNKTDKSRNMLGDSLSTTRFRRLEGDAFES